MPGKGSMLRRILRTTGDGDARELSLDKIRALRLEGRNEEAKQLMEEYRLSCRKVKEFEKKVAKAADARKMKQFHKENGYCVLCDTVAEAGRSLCTRHLELKRLNTRTMQYKEYRKKWSENVERREKHGSAGRD